MFVAAKTFPYLNRRYRLGDEIKRADFPSEEAFTHFMSLGLIEDRSPPAAAQPAAPEPEIPAATAA